MRRYPMGKHRTWWRIIQW